MDVIILEYNRINIKEEKEYVLFASELIWTSNPTTCTSVPTVPWVGVSRQLGADYNCCFPVEPGTEKALVSSRGLGPKFTHCFKQDLIIVVLKNRETRVCKEQVSTGGVGANLLRHVRLSHQSSPRSRIVQSVSVLLCVSISRTLVSSIVISEEPSVTKWASVYFIIIIPIVCHIAKLFLTAWLIN